MILIQTYMQCKQICKHTLWSSPWAVFNKAVLVCHIVPSNSQKYFSSSSFGIFTGADYTFWDHALYILLLKTKQKTKQTKNPVKSYIEYCTIISLNTLVLPAVIILGRLQPVIIIGLHHKPAEMHQMDMFQWHEITPRTGKCGMKLLFPKHSQTPTTHE